MLSRGALPTASASYSPSGSGLGRSLFHTVNKRKIGLFRLSPGGLANDRATGVKPGGASRRRNRDRPHSERAERFRRWGERSTRRPDTGIGFVPPLPPVSAPDKPASLPSSDTDQRPSASESSREPMLFTTVAALGGNGAGHGAATRKKPRDALSCEIGAKKGSWKSIANISRFPNDDADHRLWRPLRQ